MLSYCIPCEIESKRQHTWGKTLWFLCPCVWGAKQWKLNNCRKVAVVASPNDSQGIIMRNMKNENSVLLTVDSVEKRKTILTSQSNLTFARDLILQLWGICDWEPAVHFPMICRNCLEDSVEWEKDLDSFFFQGWETRNDPCFSFSSCARRRLCATGPYSPWPGVQQSPRPFRPIQTDPPWIFWNVSNLSSPWDSFWFKSLGLIYTSALWIRCVGMAIIE